MVKVASFWPLSDAEHAVLVLLLGMTGREHFETKHFVRDLISVSSPAHGKLRKRVKPTYSRRTQNRMKAENVDVLSFGGSTSKRTTFYQFTHFSLLFLLI